MTDQSELVTVDRDDHPVSAPDVADRQRVVGVIDHVNFSEPGTIIEKLLRLGLDDHYKIEVCKEPPVNKMAGLLSALAANGIPTRLRRPKKKPKRTTPKDMQKQAIEQAEAKRERKRQKRLAIVQKQTSGQS
jgi:hypothetical protein